MALKFSIKIAIKSLSELPPPMASKAYIPS